MITHSFGGVNIAVYVNSGNPITVTLPAEVADARRALWSLHKS